MRRLVAFAFGALLLAATAGVGLAWLGDARLFNVRTESMAPTIGRGALAVVSPVAAQRVKEGDVIAYRRGDARVLHRVVAITFREEGPAFVTQGDANRDTDSTAVPARDVLGKLSFALPKLGHVSNLLAPPWGILLLGGGPLVAHALTRRRLAQPEVLVDLARG